MATGFSGRLKSSEETFDHTCSQCRKKNRVSESVKYCQECHKHLCTSCLEPHNEYMEDHTLVEPSAADCGGMPTEKCRQHNQRRVELWCKTHDEVLCTMCVIMEHRSCENVKMIHDNVDTLLQDAELQETVDGLKRTQERLTTLKNAQLLTEEELLNKKRKYLGMVKEEKEKIIRIVESLGKAAEEEINMWYDESKSKLKEERECRDQIENDTIAYIDQMEIVCENKPQMFVSMKKGQNLLKTTTKIISENERKAMLDKEYEINRDIEKYLASLKTFGSFQTQVRLYKATGMVKINVKTPRDSTTCDIEDTCRLDDGSILIIDFSNRKLKRLDWSTYTVTDHVDLPDFTYSVCHVGQQEVAVSCGSNKMIQFVSVGTKMALTRSFAVNHFCMGICYRDGEVFVSDSGKHLYVYNLSGTQLRTISHNQSGEEMFSRTGLLAVSGDRIYIADLDRGLIFIDRNGRELYRYRGTQVKGGYGVCTGGQGGVFLCGYYSHNVVQIGVDGDELGVVLTNADGLTCPQSVCFNPKQRKLIVTMINCDKILDVDLIR